MSKRERTLDSYLAPPSPQGVALQRKAVGAAQQPGGDLPGAVEDVLRSPGEALDPKVRARMEKGFGRDFSGVRVHSDASAARSADAVGARAYAVGNHLVFGAGRYQPSAAAGSRLLAHELAHTVQQSRGGGADERGAEGEADRAADAIHGGGTAQVSGAAATGLQRQSKADPERDRIVAVGGQAQRNLMSRAWEIVWRMLTRYYPEYSPNVAGVGYDEKEPGVRVEVRESTVQGKKVQSAMVTVGKAFVESTSEDTLRERIVELGAALGDKMQAIADPQASAGSAALWKIINTKFAKKAGRLAGTAYDANLPGLLTEFKGGSIKAGGQTITWSAPKLYFGKAFLALPDADKEAQIADEFKAIDKWAVENGRLAKADLQDEDITLRIRGLSTAQLTELRDKVADPDVKKYVESLIGTSTPLGQGLVPQADGTASVAVGNITVVVQKDITGVAGLTGGDTSFTVPSQQPISFSWDRQGIVNRFSQPPKLLITIQTRYGAGSGADVQSGYGRGTTPDDKAVDAKTLRVHEGSHGTEYLDLIIKANAAHPYPAFDGAVGDTRQVFQAKVNAFDQARREFFDEVNRNRRGATNAVDCVGITIDEYNREHHIRRRVQCQ